MRLAFVIHADPQGDNEGALSDADKLCKALQGDCVSIILPPSPLSTLVRTVVSVYDPMTLNDFCSKIESICAKSGVDRNKLYVSDRLLDNLGVLQKASV